jgi:hypothetical protein
MTSLRVIVKFLPFGVTSFETNSLPLYTSIFLRLVKSAVPLLLKVIA